MIGHESYVKYPIQFAPSHSLPLVARIQDMLSKDNEFQNARGETLDIRKNKFGVRST
jgi:hypothetical protein